MNYKLIIMFFILFSIKGYSENGRDCQMINWEENKSYTLYSSMKNGLHIQLPEGIVFDPVSNDKIWRQLHHENSRHHWIRPNATANNVDSGGLTLIGVSGTAYNFIVVNKKGAVNCAIVKKYNGYGSSSINKSFAESNKVNAEMDAISQQIKKLERVVSINKQVSNKVSSYQDSLTSPYTFDDTKISSVHDDGRFTFILLKNIKPGQSKFIVTGEVDGIQYALDYKYESNTNKIKISGLFDKLILIKDKVKLNIVRKG